MIATYKGFLEFALNLKTASVLYASTRKILQTRCFPLFGSLTCQENFPQHVQFPKFPRTNVKLKFL